MASSADLAPLRKTRNALREIRRHLIPFLKLLDRNANGVGKEEGRGSTSSGGKDGKIDDHTLAEARTAVALATGTLRHMSARLGGKVGGGDAGKNDPLRLELEKMRKMLITLRNIDARESNEKDVSSTGGASKSAPAEPVPRRETSEQGTSDELIGQKGKSSSKQKRKRESDFNSKQSPSGAGTFGRGDRTKKKRKE